MKPLLMAQAAMRIGAERRRCRQEELREKDEPATRLFHES
jgi:hypothetical protein